MNSKREKVEKSLNECQKHIHRISLVSKKMNSFMPLTLESFRQLSDDEVEHVDQFLFRFAKLQDALGGKLFKSILLFLEEDDVRKMPFLDILNRLEQLAIIDDVDSWLLLRELRNELAHEYEDDETAYKKVNQIYEKREQLEKISLSAKQFLKKRGFFTEPSSSS
jgi:hypothetical protein